MPKINEVFVVVVEDEDGKGGEGVPAASLPNGMMVPLIAGDETRLKQIIPMAEDVCSMCGKDFVVRKFYIYDDVTEQMKERYGRPSPPSEITTEQYNMGGS